MRRNRNFIGPQGMGGMVSLWGASSLIASVQRGTISIVSVATTATATVTSVNPQNTLLAFLSDQYAGDGSSDLRYVLGRMSLTNATTVTFDRTTGNGTIVGGYELIEFYPGVIKSIQRGTISLASTTSATSTITEVNMSKSQLSYLGATTNTITLANVNFFGKLILTNSTTITANRGDTGDNLTLGYQVVEFF